jgi:2-dehydropantoate 2-reductase
MKIIILGAGAIGCLVGGYLWHAGNEVVLVGRPGQVEIINKNGLKLITPLHDHILKIPAVTSLNQVNISPNNVTFLCVKGQDTEQALFELKSVVKNIPVLCMQNGVRNEEIAARHFSKVYGAMLRIGAEYLKNGEIVARSYPPGLIILGCYPEGTDSLAVQISEKLHMAGFWVKLSDTIMAYKWGKLRSNLDNVVHAITNTTGAEVESIVKATKRELDELLKEAGIHLISQAEVAREWPEIIAPEQFDANRRIRNSTWQSFTRKQGSVETEFLNGEVVRLAKKLGRLAPLNEKLTQIAQQIAAYREQPGKYTPEKLVSILEIGG